MPCRARRRSHKVEMPTLVLWADSDAALGVGLLRGIDKEVPRAEVHVLENCSRWVQQDKCAIWSSPLLPLHVRSRLVMR